MVMVIFQQRWPRPGLPRLERLWAPATHAPQSVDRSNTEGKQQRRRHIAQTDLFDHRIARRCVNCQMLRRHYRFVFFRAASRDAQVPSVIQQRKEFWTLKRLKSTLATILLVFAGAAAIGVGTVAAVAALMIGLVVAGAARLAVRAQGMQASHPADFGNANVVDGDMATAG